MPRPSEVDFFFGFRVCFGFRTSSFGFAIVVLLLLSASPVAAQQPGVIELLEDDANNLSKQLNNDGAVDATQIRLELRDVYSGVASIRVTPFQRFSARIPNWGYPVREKPGDGQYRFIRFAWKRDGGDGIMIQLHSNNIWNQRYYAGQRSNQTATWGPMLQVDANAPREWTVVTRDLFKDWGDMNITGIALTTMENGVAGYFDHIYLGRSIEDLDRASAQAFGKTPLKEPLAPAQLAELWDELAKTDLKAAGSATRKLVAGHKASVPYLQKMLKAKPLEGDVNQIARWIAELNDEAFLVRESAHRALDKLGDAVIRHLQEARVKAASQEHRSRIDALLKSRGVVEGELTNSQLRMIRTARILEWAGTMESWKALDALAKDPPDANVLPDIRSAHERLTKVLKR